MKFCLLRSFLFTALSFGLGSSATLAADVSALIPDPHFGTNVYLAAGSNQDQACVLLGYERSAPQANPPLRLASPTGTALKVDEKGTLSAVFGSYQKDDAVSYWDTDRYMQVEYTREITIVRKVFKSIICVNRIGEPLPVTLVTGEDLVDPGSKAYFDRASSPTGVCKLLGFTSTQGLFPANGGYPRNLNNTPGMVSVDEEGRFVEESGDSTQMLRLICTGKKSS